MQQPTPTFKINLVDTTQKHELPQFPKHAQTISTIKEALPILDGYLSAYTSIVYHLLSEGTLSAHGWQHMYAQKTLEPLLLKRCTGLNNIQIASFPTTDPKSMANTIKIFNHLTGNYKQLLDIIVGLKNVTLLTSCFFY